MKYGQTQIGPNLDQIVSLDMAICIDVFLLLNNVIIRRIKGGLKGITIDDRELTKHHESSCRLLFLLIGELAIVELEQSIFLPQHVWYHPYEIVILVIHQVILRRLTPVHENISLSRMPMHVTENNYLILPELFDKIFAVVNGRVEDLGWLVPSPV